MKRDSHKEGRSRLPETVAVLLLFLLLAGVNAITDTGLREKVTGEITAAVQQNVLAGLEAQNSPSGSAK